MNNLQLAFNYETLSVRTVCDASTIWFVLRDVCEVLGIADDKQVYNRLDNDEKGGYKIPTPGGMQEMRCVNEPGLYDVIIRSNSDKSKPFRRWITHEVLPSIRKQGYYSLLSDEELIEVITEKQRHDSSFLNKIDKTSIKARVLKESREQHETDTLLLFLKQTEYSCKKFKQELKAIWNDDMKMYHKWLDKYQRWYFASGYKIVPPDEQ